ncbi:MAG: UDP-3-O-acyl-N-acetylglucosamine deacetylase [Planctomycetes bacterium]|nr:UDP-3-O-acyl-N-acetylglucosamine deacetylase [Planctomycetota bacterium]
MKRIQDRCQQTIARPVELQGIGYVTGKLVHLRFRPASACTGVVFVRTDLGPSACIAACVENVTGTARRTTLGQAPLHVGLVEHVLAALAGLRIDNCYVDLDAPEPPGLDGSALPLVKALAQAGTLMQPQRRPIWTVDRTVVYSSQDATIALHPLDTPDLRVSYLLDHGIDSPIPWQMCTQVITPGDFSSQIAPCRTFVTEQEALSLRSQGLGSRSTVADLLVFGRHGPIQNKTRFANEPARHKILDIVGDLALLGCDLRGHVVAYRSGHPHNVELVRQLSLQMQKESPRQRCAA